MAKRDHQPTNERAGSTAPETTDNELLLAQQLAEFALSEADGKLPESLVANLLPEDLEHFVQAREGLAFLNQVSPQKKTSGSVTHGGNAVETVDHSPKADIEDIPTRIGRFEIQSELGRGGFGIVLRARDPRLNRDIALKIPRASSLLQPDLLQRFQREARAAALLSHPGIVPIFETDRIGPVHYIAYEFVDGTTLSQLIRNQQTIEPELAANHVIELADAVQYAHSRGLIHRDLKPANIMVDSRSQSEGDPPEPTWHMTSKSVLRITDFGLADLQSDPENLTAENALVGTPAYMSPEQLNGKPATPANDIYALGVVLYEMLTGRVPFQGSSNLETARKVADEEPRPPRNLVGSIPKDLSAICLKCLEKQPEARYRSCQDLADDLRAFLAGRPVTARELGSLGRIIRWSQRNPLVSASLTSLFVVLVSGLISTSVLWQRAVRARSDARNQSLIAESKSTEALSQARMTREAIDQLHRAISSEPRIYEKDMEAFKLKLATTAQKYYEQLSQTRPTDLDVLSEYVDTLKILALMLQRTGRIEDSIPIWQEASEIVADQFPDDPLRWVALRSKLSEDLINTGRLQDGVRISNELVECLQVNLETGAIERDKFEQTTKQLVVQLINASQHQKRAGRFVEAQDAVDEAVKLTRLATGLPESDWPANRIWARVLRCKAEIADSQDNWQTIDNAAPLAIQLYEQLLDDPRAGSEALSSLSLLHQWLANSERLQVNFDKAILEHEKSADYLEELIERHPDVGGLKINWSLHVHRYALVLWEAELTEQAFSKISEHLPWLDQQRQEYPQLVWQWNNSEMDCRELMAKIFVQQGKLDSALDQLEQTIKICNDQCRNSQSDVGPHAFLGHLYCEKAQIFLSLDERDDAEIWIQAAFDKLKPIVESGTGGTKPPAYLKRALEMQAQIDRTKKQAN